MINTGEIRELLEECILTRVFVRIPNDIRILFSSKGNKKKHLAPKYFGKISLKTSFCLTGCTSLWQRHVVGRMKRKGNGNYYSVPILTLAQSCVSLTLRLLFNLTKRLPCVGCFINEHKESAEFLSSYFRCVAVSANKDCVSSIAITL